MQTLIIKDLAVTAELDRSAMTQVRGGTGSGYMPSCAPSYPCAPYSWGGPSFDVNKSDFNFNATQSLGQSQNTVVNNGNNVAFASGITANVSPSQHGSNNINFG
ncbi:hypothetical protein [Noviherbaspirillum autotrophicum]|uniref:Uncharacterized protein n=1 Tax=Noviherbaspirillum autotrophicum TaxID=709839 RepID=A0A0C1Y2W7_9BURK|nr:hypothetical protein [Noviherbaspirillum autotrophicum]KIF81418.1 hypothetical protein TSA66_12315 [Noviherbaspirillum autotrophicum]KIF81423.1 hypothetical protein TSA66_12345 [Noviherbaspirillum autotrophicum]